MKQVDLLYRNVFFPNWDSDMADFFYTALAELKRYSKERGFPDWKGSAPKITEWDNFYQICFKVSGLNPDSVFAEAIENVVILSGMLWCRPPYEDNEQLLFFHRVVEVPKRVNEASLRIYLRDQGEVILCVRELRSVVDEFLIGSGNGATEPVRHHPVESNEAAGASAPGKARCDRGQTPMAGDTLLRQAEDRVCDE